MNKYTNKEIAKIFLAYKEAKEKKDSLDKWLKDRPESSLPSFIIRGQRVTRSFSESSRQYIVKILKTAGYDADKVLALPSPAKMSKLVDMETADKCNKHAVESVSLTHKLDEKQLLKEGE